MALIHCPECQQNVSTQATSCPNCGYPLRPQFDSLRNDPDLVRLVERERRRRALAPVSIALAVILLLMSLILLAAHSQHATWVREGIGLSLFHLSPDRLVASSL